MQAKGIRTAHRGEEVRRTPCTASVFGTGRGGKNELEVTTNGWSEIPSIRGVSHKYFSVTNRAVGLCCLFHFAKIGERQL
jgi:hypothetical protein